MSTRVRMSQEERREVILTAAIALTREADGCVFSLTQRAVANKCAPQTGPDTVKRYFTMVELRAAVRARMGENW